MAEYVGIDINSAKKELSAIFHLGKPSCSLPFLWHFSKDMHNAVETLLGLPRFAYLENMFRDRRNPVASRLHFAFASIEGDIMTDAEKELLTIHGLHVNCYVFDGMVVYAGEQQLADIHNKLTSVGRKWKANFAVDVWG